jgi:hypothetical protein
VDPAASATLYLTIGAEVEKSTDAGATWAHLQLPASASQASEGLLARSPAAPGRLYVAQGTAVVYRSDDGGAYWASLAGPDAAGGAASALAVDASDAGRLYLSDSFEVFYSSDGGARPLTAYALPLPGIGRQVWKTGDGGATWAPADAGLPQQLVTAADLEASGMGLLYLGLQDATGATTLFTSADGAASWQAGAAADAAAAGGDRAAGLRAAGSRVGGGEAVRGGADEGCRGIEMPTREGWRGPSELSSPNPASRDRSRLP